MGPCLAAGARPPLPGAAQISRQLHVKAFGATDAVPPQTAPHDPFCSPKISCSEQGALVTVPRSMLVWMDAPGLGLHPTGMQRQAAATSLGTPAPCKGESQPRAAGDASSHDTSYGCESPWHVHPKRGWRRKRLHLGHFCTGWRAVRQGCLCQHSTPNPNTVGTRGPQSHLEPEKGDAVLRCLAGMPGWEVGD